MKRKIIVLICAASLATLQATPDTVKIVVTTESTKPICAYINNVNELCVMQTKPKSITLEAADITVMAGDEEGNFFSDAYAVKVQPETKEVTLQLHLKGQEITIETPTPSATLTRE